MAWTDATLVNEYIPSIDLIAEPTAFDASIIVAENDLRGRLYNFIAKATVDTWTLVADTPELVVSWATEMAAAYYMSTYQSYHLEPEIPDNPAAVIYDRVKNQIEDAKYNKIVIRDVAGDVVPVAGITVSAPPRWVYDLPVSQGGAVED